ncbi:Hypothetical protein AJAP_17975 [Amycolatopsis japonica]|uniref:Uncharacterized protein n=1 Tax=Amycolatopsis japonica TaxID=208439 RepID=A0A075UU14_9PSEU|nr:Hypothetical protein AJAP_17975 [Amycolatopsis japonica]
MKASLRDPESLKEAFTDFGPAKEDAVALTVCATHEIHYGAQGAETAHVTSWSYETGLSNGWPPPLVAT